MSRKLVPNTFLSFPTMRFPFSLFDDEEEGWPQEFADTSGLSVYEDENNVYIEAALPGIRPEEIEMTFDKGVLWVKAEKKRRKRIKVKNFIVRLSALFPIVWPSPAISTRASSPMPHARMAFSSSNSLKHKRRSLKKFLSKQANPSCCLPWFNLFSSL